MARTRRPIFARVYLALSRLAEKTEIAVHRDELLAGLEGRVVEVGAGNGMNVGHLPATVSEMVAVEPEPLLRARAAEAAAAASVRVLVVGGEGERLPLATGAFDAGVVSLALCSVRDPRATLAELRRVIRPGGELRFYEHVRAPERGRARLQDIADRVWPLFAGGCHTARDTVAMIEGAGFTDLRVRRFDVGARLVPIAPHALGSAREPEGIGP